MTLQFKRYDKQFILSHTHLRKYETKLGEIILCNTSDELGNSINDTTAKYIVFGVPEDIGVKANLGKGGADSAWPSFLESFLNIQSNDFLPGENIFIAGHFDFSEAGKLINVNAENAEEKIIAYRSLVREIDEQVEEMVKLITQNRKIPIIIGGGHNNAYPAIKGAAKGLYKAEMIPLAQLNCINLDAHADYRPLEGRHSGNAFRYADEDGYLNKYSIIGLHENYLQQNTLDDIINNPFIDFISYEDIFIHEKRDFIQAVAHSISFTDDNFVGIELDLDSIENVLSSAASHCGITTLQARQYLNLTAMESQIAYVHICEGATKLENGEISSSTGKLISYLVTDFIKAHETLKRK
ncbi:MAG: formimidoylglutamase [Ginsengibacter sp.]